MVQIKADKLGHQRHIMQKLGQKCLYLENSLSFCNAPLVCQIVCAMLSEIPISFGMFMLNSLFPYNAMFCHLINVFVRYEK